MSITGDAVRDVSLYRDTPRSMAWIAKTLAAVPILLQQIYQVFIYDGLNVESLNNMNTYQDFDSILLNFCFTTEI